MNKNKSDIIMETGIVFFGTICMLAMILGISYGLVALVTWAICSCFGWMWSWEIALGIWLLAVFLSWDLVARRISEVDAQIHNIHKKE